MECPNCGARWTFISRTEEQRLVTVRRRFCTICRLKFETVERVQAVAEKQEFQASLFRVLVEGDHGGDSGQADAG